MHYAFAIGARGFIISDLQTAIGLPSDGIFGPHTAETVRRLQTYKNLLVTGNACPAEFDVAGIPWPSEFHRAMNLVSSFEGTSFGDCNLRDIDGAGLTMGIAGFTTRHSEVQELLAKYLAARPDVLNDLSSSQRYALANLMTTHAAPKAWRNLFYGEDNTVRKEWRSAIAKWGRCPIMREVQLRIARSRFWGPAIQAAQSIRLDSPRARCFFLDAAVQNGGWRKSHLALARGMSDWNSGNEEKVLKAAAFAIAARARKRWRGDVLSRKTALAAGHGKVHGHIYNLQGQAIDPQE